jgi:hypothetical protein
MTRRKKRGALQRFRGAPGAEMIQRDEFESMIREKRVYASSRRGGSKRQMEFGAVEDLLESMEHSGEAVYFDAAPAPVEAEQHAPDCIARGIQGKRIAIEVTEFVCQAAVEANEKAGRDDIDRLEPYVMVHREWQRSDFLAHLQERLKKKDSTTYVGGPFDRVAVIVYTDEPMLIRSQCEDWLSGHQFGPFNQITEAYFLFGYEPEIGCCPYRRLCLHGA